LPLPLVNSPIHETVLPSSGAKVKFRQFLVGEEKILLIALEDGSEEAFVEGIKTILSRVLQTPLDLDNLPMVDIEHLFLQLRANSVGEVIEMRYTCKGVFDGKTCGNDIEVNVPIKDIEVLNKDTQHKIILYGDIGVVMKYPKFGRLQKIMKMDVNNTNEVFEVIADSIDSIFDNEQIYRTFSKQELEEFITTLPSGSLDKFLNFLLNAPQHYYKAEFQCRKCGNKGELEYKGLSDFFE